MSGQVSWHLLREPSSILVWQELFTDKAVGMVSRLPNIKEVLLSFFPSTMTQQQKGSHNGTSFLKYHIVFLSPLFILHLTSQHQRRKEKRFCSVTFQLLQNHTSPMNLINHSYIWSPFGFLLGLWSSRFMASLRAVMFLHH
jgi:hypothetical protein